MRAIREHFIASREVADTFRIKVLEPSAADPSERFPVLYATDSDLFFDALAALAASLQGAGDATRFILVGIGYENSQIAEILRWRDFYPHDVRRRFQGVIEERLRQGPECDRERLVKITGASDALDFLRFIEKELMPFIALRYPVLPNNNAYWGFSAGGTFGVNSLFTRPELFGRCILGSPSTSFEGHHFGIELARRFVSSRQALNARVFMSVGELEEVGEAFAPFDLVTGCLQLAKFLRQSAIPGLDVTLRLLPGETHATSWVPAFIQGARALFDVHSSSRDG